MKNEIKLRELFRDVGLDILEIKKRDYLKPKMIMPFEHGDVFEENAEYRIELGRIIDDRWLMEQHQLDEPTIEDYKKKWGKNDIDDFLNDKKRIGEVQSFDYDYHLEFSVFLPKSENIKSQIFKSKVWNRGLNYLTILKNSFDIFLSTKGSTVDLIEPYGALYEYEKEIPNYLYNVGIELNNDNVHLVNSVNYRLYKDNKFFYELSKYLNDNDFDYNKFMDEAISLCN